MSTLQHELVPASTIHFEEIAPATICNYIVNHPNAVLLNVRTRVEYEGRANPNYRTVKGAINIPIKELSQRLSELYKYKDKEILVYCSHSHRSPQAAYLLTRSGFSQVVNMGGVVQDTTCKNNMLTLNSVFLLFLYVLYPGRYVLQWIEVHETIYARRDGVALLGATLGLKTCAFRVNCNKRPQVQVISIERVAAQS